MKPQRVKLRVPKSLRCGDHYSFGGRDQGSALAQTRNDPRGAMYSTPNGPTDRACNWHQQNKEGHHTMGLNGLGGFFEQIIGFILSLLPPQIAALLGNLFDQFPVA